MEDIIADAGALGKKIAAHPRMKAYIIAAKAVNEDKLALDTLKEYQETVEKFREMEMSGKPIEVADKRKIAECESKVAGNDLLKKMMQAQADYLELMHRINNAIDEAAGAAAP
ncbi:MAG TPA: YlbF family regulator [Phycisphaerae bacterium]|nr:YlbF family regulator [Phycisphaerae bacterium]